MLNYFLIDERWYLVDLPGARLRHSLQSNRNAGDGHGGPSLPSGGAGPWSSSSWMPAIAPKPGSADAGLVADKPFQHLVILTKSDKLACPTAPFAPRFRGGEGLFPDDVNMLYSSVTGDGREAILKRLGTTLG